MYKQLILAILALIGVLAPCVVEVNINRTYVQEAIEYIDLEIEYVQQEAHEVAARVSMNKPQEEKGETIKTVQPKQKKRENTICKLEKRRTYLFYGRIAGGLPSQPGFAA